MMNAIIENSLLGKLTNQFQRSPCQMNRLHESDAEILKLPGNDAQVLAITTDSIVEEIALGLYDDPYLIGWMAVMVNMSDLAAVGARPLGILVSEVLPVSYPDTSLAALQRGIQDACAACQTYVLGGDTNFGTHLMLTGTALGTIDGSRALSRVGCKPGDALYATGVLGIGNAFALSQITQPGNSKLRFQPSARLNEGRALTGIASTCMDTSDGVIATLDQLMRLNGVGFEIDEEWERNLDPQSKELAGAFGIPSWLLLAGQHGEFELLFTIPKDRENLLHDAAGKVGWNPLRLGKAVEEQSISLPLYGRTVNLDTQRIRNLAFQADGDVGVYIKSLLEIDDELQKGAY
ncbi:MAG: thiamine-phosphate kinase [Bacteroidota bacterium]|jgi:thiamine-monophosphate kinase